MGITFYGPPKLGHDSHDSHESPDAHTEEDDGQAEPEEEDHDDHHSEPHDPGPAMMVPLYILAAFTVIAFVVFPFIQNIVLESSDSWAETMTEMIMVKLTMPGLVPFAITLAALAIGGIPGYIIYIKNADRSNTIIPESGFRRKLHTFLKHRWYINEFYYWVLDKFLNFAEWYRVRVDNNIIDGIDFKSADSARAISGKLRWFDDNVVDGFAEGISTQSVSGSERSQSAQTGRVNDYVGVIMFGIGLLVILALITMGVI
jgi:NADH:ubiquinone oxidoreductase subunit 5 (subunit L)/multisubunit Na+/H+ antiporter MnhA subunit